MASWGNLYMTKETKIDWTRDRINPYIDFKMPDGTWLSYSLGIFIISTPTKKETLQGITRDVEAYDKLIILKEDKIIERLTFAAGKTYYSCMVEILESINTGRYIIENNSKTIPNAKEYEPGTEKLSILNDLASDLNYTPFWVDEYGYFRSSRYISPSQKEEDYLYEDNEISVTEMGMEEELDLFDLPNVFHVVVSNPDRLVPLTATAINDNPNHPRSVTNLGRRIVRFEEKDNIADQETLNSFVERIAFETSQIFGRVVFNTALMPFHSYANVLSISNSKLGVSGKYAETDWEMPLVAGGSMKHTARRTIDLI